VKCFEIEFDNSDLAGSGSPFRRREGASHGTESARTIVHDYVWWERVDARCVTVNQTKKKKRVNERIICVVIADDLFTSVAELDR
jgi:hypothetical protein